MHVQTETIFAVASGMGRSAVAIVRASGPHVRAIVAQMIGRLPPARRAILARIIDPGDGHVIDQGLVVWFSAPASFTGEDCAEFQVHGSRAVMVRMLSALSRMEGCRAAVPGEFTKRAFLNGRIDLTQAEGLADLIDAETEWQRRHALAQLEGKLGHRAEDWRCRLLQGLALVEAEIDFVDEGDAPTRVMPLVLALIEPVVADIRDMLSNAGRSERLRDGLIVVIAGAPNVGKSTLLNYVAGRDVALVSEHAGTTRDALEVFLDLDGLPVRLIDTAGFRQTTDMIEQAGISKTLRNIELADLVLHLHEGVDTRDGLSNLDFNSPVWSVQTKIDRLEPIRLDCAYAISAVSGAGIAQLLKDISLLAADCLGAGHVGQMIRTRHHQAFSATLSCLQRCREVGLSGALDLAAEDLRQAAKALATVTGRLGVEDVLDDIFSRFCLGK